MQLSSSFLKCISFNYFPTFLTISFITLAYHFKISFFPRKSMYLYNEHFEIVRRIFALEIIKNVAVVVLISTFNISIVSQYFSNIIFQYMTYSYFYTFGMKFSYIYRYENLLTLGLGICIFRILSFKYTFDKLTVNFSCR